MNGQTIPAAAAELGIAPGTLRRWVKLGAPVARSGGKGRGRRTLINPDAVRAWRSASPADAALMELAGQLAAQVPALIADAVYEAHVRCTGSFKRACAPTLAHAGLLATYRVLDALRWHCPSVPELSELPHKLEMLRTIK